MRKSNLNFRPRIAVGFGGGLRESSTWETANRSGMEGKFI